MATFHIGWVRLIGQQLSRQQEDAHLCMTANTRSRREYLNFPARGFRQEEHRHDRLVVRMRLRDRKPRRPGKHINVRLRNARQLEQAARATISRMDNPDVLVAEYRLRGTRGQDCGNARDEHAGKKALVPWTRAWSHSGAPTAARSMRKGSHAQLSIVKYRSVSDTDWSRHAPAV